MEKINKLIKCNCGCNEKLLEYGKFYNKRRFISGHQCRGKNNPFFGKKHSKETIKKLRKRVNKNCLICKKKFEVVYARKDNAKYCSKKCMGYSKMGIKLSKETKLKMSKAQLGRKKKKEIIIKCKYCKNYFKTYISLKNKKYCSKRCYESNRPRKTIRKKCKICKKEFLAIKDYGIKNQKYCSEKCWKNRPKNYMVKTKCLNCGKIFISKQNHKNKTQKYCSLSCSCSVNAINSIKLLRLRKPYYFNGIYFDSKSEMEIALNFMYQFKIKFKEGKNVHKGVGNKECDFFIKNIFIEYHPINPLYDKKDSKGYYKERRQNLNKNGYKKYQLIVIE